MIGVRRRRGRIGQRHDESHRGYDWDNSVGFVFDPDVKSKYTSKRSRNYSQSR